MKRSLTFLLLLLVAMTGALHAHGPEGHAGPPRAMLQKIFPSATAFVPRKVGQPVPSRVRSILGTPLEGHDLTARLYVPTKGGRSIGLAWMTDAHVTAGKSANVLVGVDLDGRVVGVQLAHSPSPTLTAASFLGQFRGKTATSSFTVKAAPGQAEASRKVADAVHKAVVVLSESMKR